MLILLTNDDGINSEGIKYLKENLSTKHEVFVVAPDRERTCSAHSITLHKPLRITKHEDRVFSTNGTPADCVLLGVKCVIKRLPDLVISGINGGPNLGQDIFYSGTVAAAREGAFLGIQSIAVSINTYFGFRFEDATKIVEDIIRRLMKNPLPKGIFLNINIPNLPYGEIKGFMVTSPGVRIYDDKVIEREDPRGKKYYWIGGSINNVKPKRGTDFYAVKEGYVSVTPLDAYYPASRSKDLVKKIFRRCL
ncbi:MAG: 5'/3'-nucleotidase SurE [Desulfobacterota bacterium]|nr:5'/3'-nucleotidase SurE [Thermodesulfobacteriota bacterium]